LSPESYSVTPWRVRISHPTSSSIATSDVIIHPPHLHPSEEGSSPKALSIGFEHAALHFARGSSPRRTPTPIYLGSFLFYLIQAIDLIYTQSYEVGESAPIPKASLPLRRLDNHLANKETPLTE